MPVERVGRSVAAVSVAAAACLALACASGAPASRGGGKVDDSSQFPTPKQLEKLESTPAPTNVFDLDVKTVDTWELGGPFPEKMQAEPYSAPEDPWSALLEDAARRRAGLVVPTESMYCVARE